MILIVVGGLMLGVGLATNWSVSWSAVIVGSVLLGLGLRVGWH